MLITWGRMRAAARDKRKITIAHAAKAKEEAEEGGKEGAVKEADGCEQ